jgi:hypothetical protein
MEAAGDIRPGMRVIGSTGVLLGEVERVQGHEFLVRGAHLPLSSIARVDGESIYLGDPGAYSDAVAPPDDEADASRQSQG